jgi:DNA-binding beta-propeller fold protein YncE
LACFRRRLAIAAAMAAVLLSSSVSSASAPLAEATSVLDRVGPASFFSSPMDVAIDTTGGLIVVADTGNHRIRIFDLDGYPVASFPHRVDGPHGSQPGEPKALAVDRKGFLYVLDGFAPYIDVVDLLGYEVRRIDPATISPGGFDSTTVSATGERDASLTPVALALDPEDRLILAVGGQRSRVWGLDEHDGIRWTLDGTEEGGAPFGAITDLFVDGEGRVFVVDGTGNPAVRVFASDGRRLLGFGLHEVGYENFSLPTSVVSTRGGRIWVLDTMRQTVKVFDGEGRFLDQFGGLGRDPGAFMYPSALATDGRDHLYVMERVGARLTTFRIAESVVPATP